MITLYRWYLLKKKEIRFKLALCRVLEQILQTAEENKEDLKKLFLHDFEERIRQDSPKHEKDA